MCKRKTVEHSLKGACKGLVRVLPALWLGSWVLGNAFAMVAKSGIGDRKKLWLNSNEYVLVSFSVLRRAGQSQAKLFLESPFRLNVQSYS